MQTFRIFLLLLAFSMTGCAQVYVARLSSAKGSIENESEQSFRAGVNAKRILLLADLIGQHGEIKSASEDFSSAFYNTLSSYGYVVKQFGPYGQAERDQYLAKLEADLMRDPGLLVVRLVPKTIKVYSGMPTNMQFEVHAFVGTLRAPAYVYAGNWIYDRDRYFNGLVPIVAEHLIKAGYLAKKRD